MKLDIYTKAVLTAIALALGGCAGGGNQGGSGGGSLSSAGVEMRSCILKGVESRNTAPCAVNAYKAVEAGPRNAEKTTNLMSVSAIYKVLLAYDKGDIEFAEASEKIDIIVMDHGIRLENARTAANNQARIDDERQRQAWQDAARILRESTTPIMVPQPADNSMSCRSYRNGNEIVTNCR